MKLRGILRFELAYQLRRPWPWLAFALLVVFAYQNTRIGIMPVTLPQDFILNSPFIIASVTVISCIVWLLVASALAGDAAARDVQTGMHPLTWTTPVSRMEYLGGRFIAAFLLNAFVLLGVQVGSLLAVYAGGIDPAIIGPFRPEAYMAAYAFIALPNAWIATTVQFTAALISGRSLAGYFGSLVLLFFTFPVPVFLYLVLGAQDAALLLDPIGMFAIMNEMMSNWTIAEKNVRMFTLEGPVLLNRLLWLGIATAVLAIVHMRFRFEHRTTGDVWRGLRMRLSGRAPVAHTATAMRGPVLVPDARRSFGVSTRLLQAGAIARSSFAMLAKSVPGLFLLVVYPMFVVLLLVVESQHWGVPLIPRTGYILPKHVAAAITHFEDYRVMIPLLLVYFAGELVWRERDAGVSEYADAAPVTGWTLAMGRYLGLCLLLALLMAVLVIATMGAQVILGYHAFETGVALLMLFGLQLPEYLIFAMLVFVLHVIANHRHLGVLIGLLAWFLIIFAPYLGVEHNLMIYGAGPSWSFTDMRGFGGSVGPWLWFRLYWAAWAALLAVAVRVLWVRGRESGARKRLHIARRRLTPATLRVAVFAGVLIMTFGGFIYYNTNVLNEYLSTEQITARRAAYEHRYGRFEGVAQPAAVRTTLHIEIHPERRSAMIRGSYDLVNAHDVAIDSVHIEPAFYTDAELRFSRGAALVVADSALGHFIYELAEPLQPGDSMTLEFDLRVEPRGFRNDGRVSPVLQNGTHFTSGALPLIGYQPRRELTNPADRRKYDLPRQVTLPTPEDANQLVLSGPASTFDATIGTAAGQVAVAPGELRRSWTENGRSYFHYVSDVPIVGDHFFFSAAYEVTRERWNDVELQVFLHPGHTQNLERVLASARASLDYFGSQFGAYPYRFLTIVEQPGSFLGMGVDGSGLVTGGEGFFLLDPAEKGHDLVFEVVAHEVAHQWWGVQLNPAFAEGGILLSESLAWYSAMQVLKHTRGDDHLRRLRARMRDPNPWPPIRTGLPLLRAMDPWSGYRRGPYAFYALSEYLGEERVNAALAELIRRTSGRPATTMDLHRELIAVTPDSMRHLLRDLFETNTLWEFTAEEATAQQLPDGAWQVTLDARARKIVSDTAGVETELPMNEWVEIGVFEARRPDDIVPRVLYLQKHLVRSGAQTFTVIVPTRPARAGIDPNVLLLDFKGGDNVMDVEIESGSE